MRIREVEKKKSAIIRSKFNRKLTRPVDFFQNRILTTTLPKVSNTEQTNYKIKKKRLYIKKKERITINENGLAINRFGLAG